MTKEMIEEIEDMGSSTAQFQIRQIELVPVNGWKSAPLSNLERSFPSISWKVPLAVRKEQNERSR